MTRTLDKIANPAKHYRTPMDLYKTSELSNDEKIRALENWVDEAQHVTDATNENMPGIGEEDARIDSTIIELHKLLDKLKS